VVFSMKIASTIFFILIFCGFSFSQGEATYWYFGDHVGLDFSTGSPKVIANSAMRAEAGCSVISNKNGKLQFYTNGKEVWNREHVLMPHGYGLNGSQLLNQNSIIVPLPDSDSVYYLFTINAYYDSVGMNYSIVNMNREEGNGDVVLRNQLMQKGFVEKIAATKHCNGTDFWVIAHNRNKTFYSYLLTAQGIQDTIVSKEGDYVKADIGYMKLSPSSNRIAFPLNYDSLLVEIFRFDNKTGKVFEPLKIFAKDKTVYAYGLEFSPDGNLFYLSTGGKNYRLWQYDLTLQSEKAINENATLLAEGNHFAMQLAPDGKIYIAKQNRDYLSVINQPDIIGISCDYQEFALSLDGNNSLMGLPNFIASIFYRPGFSFKGTCLGDTTRFLYNQYLNSDSVVWNYGDGSPPITLDSNPDAAHVFNDVGNYNVKLLYYGCNKKDSTERLVSVFQQPEINLGNDTSICSTCTLLLDGGENMDFWHWQDGSESRFYEVAQPGIYSVLVSRNSCTNSDTVTILDNTVKVTVPNAFSPNNDGINDEFNVVYNELPVHFILSVYDRNGRLLYQTLDINKGWDGQYQGADCMIGTYVFKIAYNYYEKNVLYQRKKTGTLVLLR